MTRVTDEIQVVINGENERVYREGQTIARDIVDAAHRCGFTVYREACALQCVVILDERGLVYRNSGASVRTWLNGYERALDTGRAAIEAALLLVGDKLTHRIISEEAVRRGFLSGESADPAPGYAEDYCPGGYRR